MKRPHLTKTSLFLLILWFLEGILVGFGAIVPGISGGTLCAAFGMYRPAIETAADPRTGIRKYGFMLGCFLAGIALGFIGLSGLASWLMEKNSLSMTCIFIGFILGTIPQLWQEAGSKGRTSACITSLLLSFFIMTGLLFLFKTSLSLTISPDFSGYLLCGLLWGLSFILPGLSSSSLLLFFGLYQPMLKGISALDPRVILPMAAGMILCIVLLSKLIQSLYQKQEAIVSHGIIGIIFATLIMIFPIRALTPPYIFLCLVYLGSGYLISRNLTRLCQKLA